MNEGTDSPLISVIIPVHNGEQYLDQCLSSVARQTLKNIEVVIVDDASSDATAEVLRRHVEGDERLRAISHARNRGVSAARNTGLDQARGDFP